MSDHSADSMVEHQLIDWAKGLVDPLLARFEHPASFVVELWVVLAQNKRPGPLGAKLHSLLEINKTHGMESRLKLTRATFSKFHF